MEAHTLAMEHVWQRPRDKETRHLHGSDEPSSRKEEKDYYQRHQGMKSFALEWEEIVGSGSGLFEHFITTYATLQVHRLIFSSKILSNSIAMLALHQSPGSKVLSVKIGVSAGLVNVDALAGRGLGLGHHDGEDAVLQAGLDVLLVDSAREGEGTSELAD